MSPLPNQSDLQGCVLIQSDPFCRLDWQAAMVSILAPKYVLTFPFIDLWGMDQWFPGSMGSCTFLGKQYLPREASKLFSFNI